MIISSDDAWCVQLAERLGPEPEHAETWLRELVRWLDTTITAEQQLTSVRHQALARMFVAAEALDGIERHPAAYERISATIAAARAFAEDPSESAFDAYADAATASYPFGPGDGCYAVDGSDHQHAEPGTGCRTGAGSLYFTGQQFGSDAFRDAIRVQLLPWLERRAG